MVIKLLLIGLLSAAIFIGCDINPGDPDRSEATIAFEKIAASSLDSFPELTNVLQNMHVEARRAGSVIASRDVLYTTGSARLTVTPGTTLIRLIADNGMMFSIAQAETTVSVMPGTNLLPKIALKRLLKSNDPAGLRMRIWYPETWIVNTAVAPQVFAANKETMPETRMTIETEPATGVMDSLSVIALRAVLGQRYNNIVFITNKTLSIRKIGAVDVISGEFIGVPNGKPETYNLVFSITRDAKRTIVLMSVPKNEWDINKNNVTNEVTGLSKLVLFFP